MKWQDAIPIMFKQQIRKVLLRKNGWNVDVPITSHYRQGPKRKKEIEKKHLTGNTYYAVKKARKRNEKKKSLRTRGMGSKGRKTKNL